MEKTALQLLWEWVDEKYPNFNKADIEEKIKELRPVERDDAKGFFKVGSKYGQQLQTEARGEGKFLNKKDFDKYYRTKYGETDH
jgi:hypothetical protein